MSLLSRGAALLAHTVEEEYYSALAQEPGSPHVLFFWASRACAPALAALTASARRRCPPPHPPPRPPPPGPLSISIPSSLMQPKVGTMTAQPRGSG